MSCFPEVAVDLSYSHCYVHQSCFHPVSHIYSLSMAQYPDVFKKAAQLKYPDCLILLSFAQGDFHH